MGETQEASPAPSTLFTVISERIPLHSIGIARIYLSESNLSAKRPPPINE